MRLADPYPFTSYRRSFMVLGTSLRRNLGVVSWTLGAIIVGSGCSVGTTGGTGIDAITVSPGSATLVMGRTTTQQFTAVARNAQGTTMGGETFTWDSSDTGVVTIDSG